MPLSPEPLLGDRGVVKRHDAIHEDLIATAPHARDKYRVTTTGVCEGDFNRRGTIRLDTHLSRLTKPGEGLAEDLNRIFRARAAQRQNHAIRGHFGGCSQCPSLRLTATAITAQHAVNAAGYDRSDGRQRFAECLRGLRGINSHLKILSFANRLEMAGDRLHTLKPLDDRGFIDFKAPRKPQRRRSAGRRARADQRQMNGEFTVKAV